ncbi:MAG: hypothetical protein KDB22_04250 [Planctomycetales bacterium]|nr:hypothetical protein [Planctomycetales bacterium]
MTLEGEEAKQWFKALRKRNQELAAFELWLAREKALAEGKQPFDLDYLYRHWPTNPDDRVSSLGGDQNHEQRLEHWENLYYRSFPAIATMPDFVEKMKQLQLEGFFD